MACRLLARGCDVDHRRHDGATALALAAHPGHQRLVEVLLEAAAGLEGCLKDGVTPLLLACREGHGEVVRSLCALAQRLSELPRSC